MIRLNAIILRTRREKSRGLIGADNIYPVMFETHWGIHTFGVRHPIDVLILDTNNQVVRLVHHILPNRVFFWNPKHKVVIELPAGEIEKKGIVLGTLISLRPHTRYV